MSKTSVFAITLGLGTLLLSPAALSSDHKLSEWGLGPTLFGAEISKDDMQGKVVVIEEWGVQCPPCIALLPHMVKLDRRYRDKGLLIIGAESQGHNKEEIAPLVKKNRIEYTITAGVMGPNGGNGLPHAYVFGVDGQMIFDGSPGDDDFEKTVKNALKEVGKVAVAPSISSGNLFETQTWTNAEGAEISAAVRGATETEVTFIMFSGKMVTYPLEKLSETSRRKITEARIAREAVDVTA